MKALFYAGLTSSKSNGTENPCVGSSILPPGIFALFLAITKVTQPSWLSINHKQDACDTLHKLRKRKKYDKIIINTLSKEKRQYGKSKKSKEITTLFICPN